MQNASCNEYNGTQGIRYVQHTRDGLVVCWGKNLARKQLNVDIWQVVISGKRPTDLKGSSNNAISVSYQQLPDR